MTETGHIRLLGVKECLRTHLDSKLSCNNKVVDVLGVIYTSLHQM